MALTAAIQERFERSFGLWRDLVDGIGEPALSLKLPDLPSNTIGAQLWCVVGARESYSHALTAGGWSGFTCSLDDPSSATRVREALLRSEAQVRTAAARMPEANAVQAGLILDLLEHEAAHQGQLIRYLYALRLPIPPSWKARYALA